MAYLGTYNITPAHKEITVDCWGISYPKEKQTLEHQGNDAYCELEKVTHESLNISDYLSSDVWDELESKINEK